MGGDDAHPVPQAAAGLNVRVPPLRSPLPYAIIALYEHTTHDSTVKRLVLVLGVAGDAAGRSSARPARPGPTGRQGGPPLSSPADRPAAAGGGVGRASAAVDPALKAQQYRLKTEGGRLTISGGSPVAVLYGAYAFASSAYGSTSTATCCPTGGFRWRAVLDEAHRRSQHLPCTRVAAVPRFSRRARLVDHRRLAGDCRPGAKLRMNFVGLHTLPVPQQGPGAGADRVGGAARGRQPRRHGDRSDPYSWYTTPRSSSPYAVTARQEPTATASAAPRSLRRTTTARRSTARTTSRCRRRRRPAWRWSIRTARC